MDRVRYYAAHRVWIVGRGEMLAMCRVGIDGNHRVVSMESFDGELSHTEWLGGLIITDGVYAFHVSSFNVADMKFTSASQIRRL